MAVHFQSQLELPPYARGFHIISQRIFDIIPNLPQSGILSIFIQHTSAGLCINENADPTVRLDFESSFNVLVKENEPFYEHNYEGPDDMPAHIKSALVGSSLSIPIINGKLALGTWQGIYLCEFRNNGGGRNIIITVLS